MANSSRKNRVDIVDKAMNLYWEKGFHGTSMRNLQDVIDMRPGSIYATFGSKEGLFKEALQHYAQQGIDYLAILKVEKETPLQGLKAFVESAVIASQKEAPSGMCMLAKTISELTEDNDELLAEAKFLLSKMEDVFADTIKEAQISGEVPLEKDAKQLACYLQVQIMGLRTYLRLNTDTEPVSKMIDDLFCAMQQEK